MQTNQKSLKWPLIVSLCLVGIVIGVLNFYQKEPLMIVTDIMNVIIVIPLVVFSLILVVKNRLIGSLGKAWLCFTVCAISWSVAEVIWALDEVVFKQDPFPSSADFFWLVGFPFYLAFAFLYLKPFRNTITVKTIVFAVCVSAVLMGFLIYSALSNSELPQFEIALLVSYPVGDAVCLIPTIIGFVLFFRGQVNFTWMLLLVGMFSFVIGDSAYQILSQNDQYYTGHPSDIVYLWAYVFFVFGVYDHNRIFRTRNAQNKFNDQEKLR